MKELLRDIVIVLLVVIVIATLIKPIVVQKTSMEPTLSSNQYLMISRQAYHWFGDPKRGDIIVFPHVTSAGEELYIKRVIGLPGETITITGGQVYIDGELLEEAYTKDGVTPGEVYDYVVPEGKVYVMGDNRLVSVDSRSENVGCVDISQISGKAFLRVWPLSKFGTI